MKYEYGMMKQEGKTGMQSEEKEKGRHNRNSGFSNHHSSFSVDDKPEDIRIRTKEFALRIIRLYAALPKSRREAQVIGDQFLRSGTSVGAHLREGKRSRSDAEYISKTEGALQELEETVYWLELLGDSGIMDPDSLKDLLQEADEITAILVTSVKTVKARRSK